MAKPASRLTGKSKIAPTRAHEQSTRAQPKIIHTRGGTPTLRASLLQLQQLSHRTDPAVWVGKADGPRGGPRCPITILLILVRVTHPEPYTSQRGCHLNIQHATAAGSEPRREWRQQLK
jgi:hypothetical protein